jgi:Transketolase, pyrimidine binding domain
VQPVEVHHEQIAKRFPTRLINVGIAEQDLIGVSAGLANGGLIPFVGAAAPFLTGRAAFEQIKADIAYARCVRRRGLGYTGVLDAVEEACAVGVLGQGSLGDEGVALRAARHVRADHIDGPGAGGGRVYLHDLNVVGCV